MSISALRLARDGFSQEKSRSERELRSQVQLLRTSGRVSDSSRTDSLPCKIWIVDGLVVMQRTVYVSDADKAVVSSLESSFKECVDNRNAATQKMDSLSQKIRQLEGKVKKLKTCLDEVKDHSLREKVKGVLVIAGFVALVAVGIFLCVQGFVWAPALTAVLPLAYGLASLYMYVNKRAEEDLEFVQIPFNEQLALAAPIWPIVQGAYLMSTKFREEKIQASIQELS